MSGPCCSSPGNEEVFTARAARRGALLQRWFGHSPADRRLLGAIPDDAVRGARVLEIGGGLGQVQLALLDRGAVHATNLDLTANWEEPARRLAADAGHTDRVTRFVGDAAAPPELEPADLVVLHRVVCCTREWRAMLDTALSVGPTTVAITLPRDTRVGRAVAAVGNTLKRWSGSDFRFHLHDPVAVLGHLRAVLPAVVADVHGPQWRSVVLSTVDEASD